MIRIRSHRRSRIAVLVACLLASAVAAPVIAHEPDPVLGPTWEDDTALTFRWRSGAEPVADIKTAIREAATDNNATKASQAATFTYASGGLGLVGYGPGATCGVNGIGCFTRNAPDGGFTMWLREQGRTFDWGTLKWCQLYASAPNGCYDAETIALDEFGHIQGLDHHENHSDDRDYLDAVVQTFSRTRPSSGWNMHVYGRCDVATLQLRYDVSDWTTPYSACLDLATTLTLSASPTSIPYGGTTRLTAVLKVGDVGAYYRLKINPISERTVRLQRRAPGASTWTTVGSMPATGGSGTYALTLKLQTDAEFRATFTAPSSEGLRNDTSGTVRVSVADCTGSCPLSAPATGVGE